MRKRGLVPKCMHNGKKQNNGIIEHVLRSVSFPFLLFCSESKLQVSNNTRIRDRYERDNGGDRVKDSGKEGGVESSMMAVQWVLFWLDSINEVEYRGVSDKVWRKLIENRGCYRLSEVLTTVLS
ncbi:unnamed protein product [Lactuca virosa]|uniref:Uncharacterized protein n=1 Tax=Lactuca virosa TaxID=75947 RepID=A0AAU9LU38_9ASTR|nr:unnamed protein product [Lactuca virosa]